MEANKLPKGQSSEVSDTRNEPGVYRHPDTGAEISCYPGKRAVAQADAYVRLGFVRVGPVPTIPEIHEKDQSQIEKQKAEDSAALKAATSETLELKAKLAEAEAAKVAAEKKAEDAKAEAEAALKMAQESEKSNKKESK